MSEPLLPSEPSVLDYLKERLRLHRPSRSEEPPPTVGSSVPPQGAWFWPLLPLLFGLTAQWLLEPPRRMIAAGLVFYALALVTFGRFVLGKRHAEDADPSPSQEFTADFSFRHRPLLLSLLFALLAFLTFGGNRFTPLNLTFWGLALFFYFRALWQPQSEGSLLDRARALLSALRAPSWTLEVRREHVLLILVLAVAVFFRLHRLSSVPLEPFSDQAEKILDVYDVTQGKWSIFFPRNTGREAFQMYWTALIAALFGTGLSFQSLKLGTALLGVLTLPYLYLLGREIGGRRVGLLAVLLGGIAFWPNIISRIGLRFPLYPLFTAPTLYYLLRGLRSGRRNDFLFSGLFLGLGLHGYSPFRIVPFLVVIAIALYGWHIRRPEARRQAIFGLLLIAVTALLVFLPLLRYALENPQMFAYRAFSRLTSQEAPIPGNGLLIFLQNVWRALLMFHWDDGNIWVVSIPHRPALDLVAAIFLLFGVLFLLWRYLQRRHWQDLFLLLAIPVLQLPSTLSLAFPEENPAPNRAGGVYIIVFVIVALALDAFLRRLEEEGRPRLAQITFALLLFLSLGQNYSLTFQTFDRQYRLGTWNSSEMGAVIKQFALISGTTDTAWIVPYPYWVDTRLPGVWAGIPNRDFALWPDQLEQSLAVPPPKLFLYHPNDTTTAEKLRQLYPDGILRRYPSATEGHDFYIFYVP